MRDIDIRDAFGISEQTLQKWKKTSTNDWRAKLYTFLSLKTVEEIKPDIERIEKILKIREDGKK